MTFVTAFVPAEWIESVPCCRACLHQSPNWFLIAFCPRRPPRCWLLPVRALGRLQSMPPLKSFPLKSNLERALIRSANKSFEFQGSSTFLGCCKFAFGADLPQNSGPEQKAGWEFNTAHMLGIKRGLYLSSKFWYGFGNMRHCHVGFSKGNSASIVDSSAAEIKMNCCYEVRALKWKCWSRLKSLNEWPSFEFVRKCVTWAKLPSTASYM